MDEVSDDTLYKAEILTIATTKFCGESFDSVKKKPQ